jgi:hypothetical protein
MTDFMTNVLNFLNKSSTTTVTFSMKLDLIPMLSQQFYQPISGEYMQAINRRTILSTGVSFQFLGRKLAVVSLQDSAVGSGQPTEIKTKNLGNIGLNIEQT